MTSAVELERLSIPVADLNLVADAAGPTDAPGILFLHGGIPGVCGDEKILYVTNRLVDTLRLSLLLLLLSCLLLF